MLIPEGNILVYSEGSKVKCPKIVYKYKGEEHVTTPFTLRIGLPDSVLDLTNI
jgi:hypothetical protein